MVNSADCLRGLYVKAALMAHDCVANTQFSINDDLTMIVLASVDIKESAPIFFNYTSCLKVYLDNFFWNSYRFCLFIGNVRKTFTFENWKIL